MTTRGFAPVEFAIAFVYVIIVLWAIGAVGSASHRHCGGHVFESRIAQRGEDFYPLFFYKYKENIKFLIASVYHTLAKSFQVKGFSRFSDILPKKYLC